MRNPDADPSGFIHELPFCGTLEEMLAHRIDAVTSLLEAQTPAAAPELERLDPRRREMLFWYHGYLSALRALRASIGRGALH